MALRPAWKTTYPDKSDKDREILDAAKKEWLAAFKKAGISSWEIIEAGLGELSIKPGVFIPSPGDFIQCCKEARLKDYGVPSEEAAFDELQRFMGPRFEKRDFSKLNRVIYTAYRKMDWGRVQTLRTDDQKEAFRKAWERTKDQIMAGREPDRYIKEQLPTPSGTVHSGKSNKAVGEKALSELKGLFE